MKINMRLFFVFVLINISIIIDAMTTHIGIDQGYIEQNPIIVYLGYFPISVIFQSLYFMLWIGFLYFPLKYLFNEEEYFYVLSHTIIITILIVQITNLSLLL